MNIKELNERIEQLTNLVISADETIKNAKEMITLAEQERDRLADQRRESEPKFERVGNKEYYWYVDTMSGDIGKAEPRSRFEAYDRYDDTCFDNNNYFHTEKRAQEVADKLNFILKLERLHDIYCPDYIPDWNDYGKYKYTVFYDYRNRSYCIGSYEGVEYKNSVYFATREIAQKVCDILNAELKENEGNCNE